MSTAPVRTPERSALIRFASIAAHLAHPRTSVDRHPLRAKTTKTREHHTAICYKVHPLPLTLALRIGRMPAPIAPLIGFALGVAFAWWAREELARSQASAGVGSRSLVIVTLFATVVFAPIGAYFLAFEADWSYAIFVDTGRIPSALQLALVLLDAASVPVGSWSPHRTRARANWSPSSRCPPLR